MHLRLFNKDAIRRNSVSGIKFDDVTNHYVSSRDLLNGSILSANDSCLGVERCFMIFSKLPVLTEAADCLNRGREDDCG